MKTKLFIAIMLSAILFIDVSCKKTETIYTAPSPESASLSTTYLVNAATTVTATGSGNYEYGFKFSVNRNGKITKLGSKMPTAGSYRVTLWEVGASTQTVIGQATITQGAGILTLNSITAVPVTTGKDYFVSIWSNTNWYEIRPLGVSSFTYPITTGSVIIKGYQWIGAPQTPIVFPTNSDNSYVAGLADFEFQAD